MASSTTTMSAKKRMLAGLAVASVLFLSTGCAPEVGLFGEGPTSDSGSGSSNSESQDNSNPSGGDESDGKTDDEKDNKNGGNPPDDPATVDLKGKECIVGTWVADNATIEKVMSAESGGASVKTSGQVIVTYSADGSAQNNYDQWANTVSLEGATSTVVRHGIDKGTYTATDTTLTVSDSSIGSTTKVTAKGPDGHVITMEVDPEPSVLDGGPYTCDGDLLTMKVEGYGLKMFRQN